MNKNIETAPALVTDAEIDAAAECVLGQRAADALPTGAARVLCEQACVEGRLLFPDRRARVALILAGRKMVRGEWLPSGFARLSEVLATAVSIFAAVQS